MNTSRIIKDLIYSEENTLTKEHFHDDYQIVYVKSGSIRIVLGAKVFNADEQSLVFISNLENHSITIVDKPCERYYLNMPVRELEETLVNSQLLSVFKNRPPSFCNVFRIEPIMEEISFLFQLLHNEIQREPNDYSERYVRHIINVMVLTIYRNNQQQFPILRESVKSQIYDIQKYLDHHYTEPLSLMDLCKDFYISFSYLSRCFKNLTGYSPKQYIMIHRLTYARTLIITTDLSISDIAYKSGFGDVNNFIRHFRRRYGQTPTHLRKDHTQW